VEKIKHVVMRREQAKQSAVECKVALDKQRRDNKVVAALMKKQGSVIKKQMEIENEIAVLRNKEVVQRVSDVRDTKPKEATQRVLKGRKQISDKLREELEAARLLKEQKDAEEEEFKTDQIRQLKALNTVHRKHIVVFDPTQTAGIGLLDEMSYMEMKERQKGERQREQEAEEYKRCEILEMKSKKQADLERRTQCIMQARQVRTEHTRKHTSKMKEDRFRREEETEKARLAASAKLGDELQQRRESSRLEKEALKAEEDRIRRQQQYLGAAVGQAEKVRDEQLRMAQDRQARTLQQQYELERIRAVEANVSDRKNKLLASKQDRIALEAAEAEREQQYQFEKHAAVDKLKGTVVEKKEMFKEGQRQHAATRTVTIEHNPYASKISEKTHAAIEEKKRKSLQGISTFA